MDSQLFVSAGRPLEFFVPQEEENRQHIVQTVTENGGKVVDKEGDAIFLSSTAEESRNPVDPKFVYESIEKKQCQDPSDYRSFGVQHIMNYLDKEAAAEGAVDATESGGASSSAVVAENAASTTDPATSTTTAPSSATADAAAVAAATATAAATAISETVPQTREDRLAAASAVPNGMFVTREDRINLHNKNGFTQQEDEMILEEVRKHPHRRSTHKLYDEIAIKIGRHTGNSIRYRYRTHLAVNLVFVYKVDDNGELVHDDDGELVKVNDMPKTLKNKFTANDDYALCKEVRVYLNEKGNSAETDPKDIVLPGKFFEKMSGLRPGHSRAAWRDRYRKFAIPFGIDKYISYYEVELGAGREPIEMKNFTGRHLYKGAKAKKTEDDNIDAVISERLGQHNDQFQETRSYKKRKPNANAASSTSASTAAPAQDDAANVFLSGDQNALAGIASSNLFESQAAQAVAVATNSSAGVDPEEFLTEDLVTSKFFSFQPLHTVVAKITEIVNRNYESGDAEQLIDALYEETGIQKKFGTFIITSVCGDVVLIPKYFEQFLKTGQNPPEDVHGVWSPRDDAFLKSNDPEGMEFLRRLHGQKRIELRKTFAENLSDWVE